MFFTLLSSSYTEEKVEWEGSAKEERVVLKLPPAMAPVQLAILPLMKKDQLPEKAREIMDHMKYDFNCLYEEKDSIGKRYRRQDAIGTPFCITIDHDTLNDNTVTIRYRDSMQQERVDITRLPEIMTKKVSQAELLRKLE
jgi:glycyl-tRNA synthetase